VLEIWLRACRAGVGPHLRRCVTPLPASPLDGRNAFYSVADGTVMLVLRLVLLTS
jgi:hypothetical protein